MGAARPDARVASPPNVGLLGRKARLGPNNSTFGVARERAGARAEHLDAVML